MRKTRLAATLVIASAVGLTACGTSSSGDQKAALDSALAAYQVPVVLSGVGPGKFTLPLPQVLLGSSETRPITFVAGQPKQDTKGWSVGIGVLNGGSFGAPTGVAEDIVDFPASMDARSTEVTVTVAKGTIWAIGVAAGSAAPSTPADGS